MLTHITEYFWSRDTYDISRLFSSCYRFSTELQRELTAPVSNSASLVLLGKIQQLNYWSGLGHMFFFEPIAMFRDNGVLASPGSHVLFCGLEERCDGVSPTQSQGVSSLPERKGF